VRSKQVNVQEKGSLFQRKQLSRITNVIVTATCLFDFLLVTHSVTAQKKRKKHILARNPRRFITNICCFIKELFTLDGLFIKCLGWSQNILSMYLEIVGSRAFRTKIWQIFMMKCRYSTKD